MGEGTGTPLQYSCLENPMDRGAWWAAVHGVAKSRTRLSDVIFIFHFHALEEEMATHSSVLAWRIPGTEEPGGLPSMGSHRIGHNWRYLAAAAQGKPTFASHQWQVCLVYTEVHFRLNQESLNTPLIKLKILVLIYAHQALKQFFYQSIFISLLIR